MNYAVRTERANTEKYVESAARGMPNCTLTNYETVLGDTNFDKVVFMGVLLSLIHISEPTRPY